MYIPQRGSPYYARSTQDNILKKRYGQDTGNGGSSSSNSRIIFGVVFGVVFSFVVALVVGILCIRRRKQKKTKNAETKPPKKTKKTKKKASSGCSWSWFGLRSYGQVENPQEPMATRSMTTVTPLNNTQLNASNAAGGAQQQSSPGNGATGNQGSANTGDQDNTEVNRHQSVRSVMTLPPYSLTPKATEQIIAREGERAGMDMVVEFPESAAEQEARREEEMESLYQIRVARRQENAEREARRQARREAQNANDEARIRRLNQESRARRRNQVANANGGHNQRSAMLIAQHQSRDRAARVAEVTYGDIGHVRADGSRIRPRNRSRAQSAASDADSRPLLLETIPSNDSRGRSSVSLATTLQRPYTAETGYPMTLTNTAASQATDISRPSGEEQGSYHGVEPAEFPPVPPPQYEDHELGEAPAYESQVGSNSTEDTAAAEPAGSPRSRPRSDTRDLTSAYDGRDIARQSPSSSRRTSPQLGIEPPRIEIETASAINLNPDEILQATTTSETHDGENEHDRDHSPAEPVYEEVRGQRSRANSSSRLLGSDDRENDR